MKKTLVIILLSILWFNTEAQIDSTWSKNPCGESKEVIDTMYVKIVFTSRAGGLYLVPGLIITHGIKTENLIGYDTIYSKEFYIYRSFNKKKLRKISENRIWDYKSLKKTKQ